MYVSYIGLYMKDMASESIERIKKYDLYKEWGNMYFSDCWAIVTMVNTYPVHVQATGRSLIYQLMVPCPTLS